MSTDIHEGQRSFEMPIDGEMRTFYIAPPTADHLRKADWHYSKTYNRAMVEGIATTSEMMGILSKRGLYNDDYKNKLTDLQVEVTKNILAAQAETNLEKKKELAQRAAIAREELFSWNQRITGPLNNCCEQLAEDAKMEYLTSAMIRDANDKPVWNTYEDFLAEKNSSLSLMSRYEVLLTFQGLEKNFLENMPENLILSEIAAAVAAEEELSAPAQLSSGDAEEDAPAKKRKSRAKKSSIE